MSTNPLKKLEDFGQSIWIDFLSRAALTSDMLKRWINEDGVSGVTSNPSIFEKAIVDSNDYDDEVDRLRKEGRSAADIYDAVTIYDIQHAADLLRPLFQSTRGADGYVSLEVSPHLANDTTGTIAEARRLYLAVNRPNVMIKIPGTRAGLPAIQQMISDGVNINVTLLFGLPRYMQVVDAYLSGLENRVERGQPISQIASVASFFLSRIDVLIDPLLENIMQGPDAEKANLAQSMRGQAAIASAKIAYQMFNQAVQSQRFQALAEKGAQRQRLLWASTSTKNPAYSDVKYVEPLIGPETINTMPVETLDAYRDHGSPAPRLGDDIQEAQAVLSNLQRLGIDIDAVTQQLEEEGVEKFNKSYNQLMQRLAEKVKTT